MKKLRKAMIAAILLQSVSLFEYCSPASADFDFTINWDDAKTQYVFKYASKGLFPDGHGVTELGTNNLLNWEDIYYGFGGRCIMANERLTMPDDYTVNFNLYSMTGQQCIIRNEEYQEYQGKFISGDAYTSGGTITGVGNSSKYGILTRNVDDKKTTITLNNTNFILDNFYTGIKNNYGIVKIINNQTSFHDMNSGVRAYNDAEVSINTNNLLMSEITYGIWGIDNSKIVISGTKADMVSQNYAVLAYDNSNVNLNSKEINFQDGLYGIYGRGEGSEVNINNVNIADSMVNVINVENFIDAGDNSKVNILTNQLEFGTSMPVDFAITAVKSTGTSNVNISAKDTIFNGNIIAYDSSKINFKKDEVFDSQSVAIYSDKTDAVSGESDDGNAKINFEVNSYINSQGDEIYHADKQDVRTIAAIRALRNSEITLDNAAGVYGDIIAGRGIDNSDATGGKITINSVDYADFKGDVLAGNDGVIDLTLNNANYEGRVDDYADATLKNMVFRPKEFDVAVTDGGTVNMTLNNSTWTARGQNFVTELDFGAEGGFVDLSQDENNSVTIRNLNGNGTFNMLLNSEDHSKSDMLYIGKNTGSQTINIVGGITGGLENISKDNPLRFATVGIDSVSDVPDVNNSGISAYTRDGGVFDVEYTVEKEDFDKADAENEKYNGTGDGKGVDKPGNDFVENALVGNRDAVNWIITGAKEQQESDAGKTIINMSKVNYNNAIYMDRLNKRLGEARYISPEDEQGMWVRIRHDRIGKDDAFRSQNTMYEMGYDEKQDCDNGERRVGFAIDYMDGKAEYSGIAGDGDVKRYGLWMYDTWMGDKGHYADYVAKWGHLENDFDIMARSTSEKITGDYSNNVFSVSAEYGRKKDIGNNWYFEPQAQLQLARVTGASYTTSQNTDVTLDGINSLIGRAGFRLGRDVNERSTVYVKADLLHEFLGDQTITATDVTGTLREEYENKGTWYDVGFGFATALGKDSYAFMDFEKSFGNDNDETYQINAGVQWRF